MNKNKFNRPATTKVEDVSFSERSSYVASAKQYNENISNIDTVFSKITPQNNLLIVRCLTDSSPVQVEVQTNESAQSIRRMLHPQPLIPVGVVVCAKETSQFKVGDFVQIPVNLIVAQNSLSIPSAYLMPFKTNTFGYVSVQEHQVIAKLSELPTLDYVELEDTITDSE